MLIHINLFKPVLFMTAVMLKQILGTGLSWYTSTDAKAMGEIDIMVESAVLCFRQSFRCLQLCNMIFYLNFDFEVILHRFRRLKDRRNHGPADSAMISSPPNLGLIWILGEFV